MPTIREFLNASEPKAGDLSIWSDGLTVFAFDGAHYFKIGRGIKEPSYTLAEWRAQQDALRSAIYKEES